MTADDPGVGCITIAMTVEVRDLKVIADIGVRRHEMGRPQELVVSVKLEVMPPTSESLEDAFDYALIAAHADALGRERIGLIETYVRRLAVQLLDHPLVERATVSADKPRALESGIASASVTMGKSRSR